MQENPQAPTRAFPIPAPAIAGFPIVNPIERKLVAAAGVCPDCGGSPNDGHYAGCAVAGLN